MWFRRPEFDRYADFRCDSAIRGGFKWDELCEVELPVPSLKKQQEIVNDYNTVQERIAINEQLNTALEATAQALYKHWFVDFEFPYDFERGVVAVEHGKPYQSSGGEMVFNEVVDKEIPKGWEVLKLGDLISHKKGKAFKSGDYQENGIAIVRVSDLTNSSVSYNSCYFLDPNREDEFEDYKLNFNDIIITSVGSWASNPDSVVGKVVKVPYYGQDSLLNQNMVRLRANNNKSHFFIYTALRSSDFYSHVISGAQGSANQASVTLYHLFDFRICIPPRNDIYSDFKNLFDEYSALESFNNSISKLSKLLLSKIATVTD